MMESTGRLRRRFFCFCVLCALLVSVIGPVDAWAAIPKTSVNDVLYRADGSAAHGTVTIRWNPFTASDGSAVAAGVMAVKIGTNGNFSVQLVPNTGAKPEGSYYKVVMKLDDGTTSEEAWAVPAAPTTTVAAVRATVMPASTAVQYVGRDYVDTALATQAANDVQTNGSYADPVWLSSLSASKIVGTLSAGILPSTVVSTNAQNTFTQPQAFANINGCRYAGQVGSGTIQAAINDAGTTGCVVIPKSYTGTDSFTNPNSISIVDFRRGTSSQGVINVLDYGADATGSNDSQPAFQAAHDAQKGCVYIPAGTYKLSSPVRYTSGACFYGNPVADAASQKTVLKPASAAFVPANPLTFNVGVTFRSMQIYGGQNAIELNLAQNTDLENLQLWDQTGFGIVHIMGERHLWKNLYCMHMFNNAAGCISLNDPSQSIYAANYASGGWSGANAAGWFDRAELDHIVDVGGQSLSNNGKQDAYFIKATTSSCNGCGWVSNLILRQPVIMWAANQGILKIDGSLRMATLSNFTLDTLGSASAAMPNGIYVGGQAIGVTIDNYNPANGAPMWMTNAINVRDQFLQSTIMDSALGGNSTTLGVGLRLGASAPAGGPRLLDSSGYVYVESVSPQHQNQAFEVTGGAITSNLNTVGVNGPVSQDYRMYFGPSDGIYANNTSNYAIKRWYGGAVATDLNLGPTSSFVRTPFTMQNGATVLGTLGIGSGSYQTTLQSASLTASNTVTLPNSTDTLVGRATTDTLTNKTFDTASAGNVLKISGNQITAVSGNSGRVATSASVTTDAAGQPACWDGSHNLTNAGCNGSSGSGNSTVASIKLQGQTSAITSTALYAPSSAGQYRVSVYMVIHATGTSGYIQPYVSYGDGVTTKNVPGSNNTSVATLGATNSYTQTVWAAAGQAISYGVSFNSVVGSPTYDLYIALEKLQ